MSRIPLTDVSSLTGTRREQYERFPSNLTRAILLLDDRLARSLPETANALRASELDPAWREALILRVAALTNSAYERFQHLDQAHAAGWTDEEIADIEQGRLHKLPADIAIVLAFADECVADTRVAADTFAAALDVLGDRRLVTVIVLIGHYMTVARLTGVLEIELDDSPDTWTREH
jgi:alkylhydroperoxidase family enzyme